MSGEHPNPADLRRQTRYSFVANVDIAWRDAQDSEERHYWGSSQNISMGGMFVASSAPVVMDALVTADIYPVGVPPLRLYARVVHVREDGFGCIFTRVSQQAEVRLHRWLGRCGGLPPVAGTIGDVAQVRRN